MSNGASYLHLESGLQAAIRVRGALRTIGDPIPAKALLEVARRLLGETQSPHFLERRSHDFSKTIQGVRCRINVFQTSRRHRVCHPLAFSLQATIEKLNLHLDLKKLILPTNGLILVSGPYRLGQILPTLSPR